MFLFGSFLGSLGIFGQKWCLECFDLKKYAQHEKNVFFLFFFIFVFFGLVFGQVCGNMGKNPLHPQI